MPPVDRRNPIRASSSDSTCSLLELAREFPDDESCLVWLWRERFAPDGEHAHCPRCDAERVFKRYDTAQKRPCWFCRTCGYRIHPMKGTIYERSSTSLQLWFYALYIMASTRCGISAKQLERELGVNYKTAWRMFNKIRNELMIQDDAPLSGDVEADETFVGGKPRQSERNALREDLRGRGRSHADHRGILRTDQKRDPWRLPLRLPEVVAGVPERVRVALQPQGEPAVCSTTCSRNPLAELSRAS